jgi:glycosyltransferase involved in cell wall biosynthesis
MKNKLIFITNIPTPYKISFFNELNRYFDLTVVYVKSKSNYRHKEWMKNNNTKFEFFDISNNSLIKKLLLLKNYTKNKIIILNGYYLIVYLFFIIYLNLFKIKYYLNVEGGFFRTREFFLLSLIKRYVFSHSPYIFSSGDYTNEYLIKYSADKSIIHKVNFSSIFESDIKVIDFREKFHLRLKHNLPKNSKIVLFVGSFITRKGIDLIIDTIQSNRITTSDLFFILIGGKPDNLGKSKIKELQNTKLSNYLIIDYLDKSELFEYYTLSDFFLLPTREDIWGLVINEAMSKGLPIISTKKSIAALELVDKSNGFLLDDISINSIVNALLKLSKMDEISINKLSANSSNRIKSYTIENYAKQINDYIKQNGKNR